MASRASLIRDIEHARREGIYAAAQDAAADHGVPLAFLLAVGSRESRLGRALPSSCIGQGGEYGVWQINPFGVYARWAANHTPCNVRANAQKAADILADELRRFNGNYKRAAAAYNTGPRDVQMLVRQGRDPDEATTGDNYGADVVDRMQKIASVTASQMPNVTVSARQGAIPQWAIPAGLFAVVGVGAALWARQDA